MVEWFQQWFVPAGSTGPVAYVVAAAAALLLTAIGKGGFGGLGALSIPVLLLAMRPGNTSLAIAMWAPVLILCDLLTLPFYVRQCSWRPILILAPWTTLGLFAGRICLDWFNRTPGAEPWLKVTIGALSILFALSQAARYYVARRAQRQVQPWVPTWWQAVPFGLSAGITTMIAHAAGSIFAMYMIPQQFDRRVFVGTSARYYLIFNTLKIPFFIFPMPFVLGASSGVVQGSYLTWESLRLALWLIPLAPLGVYAGHWLNNNFSNRNFTLIVNILLALTGVWLIYANLPR